MSQHAAKSFSYPKYGDLRTPPGDDGRTPDGLIKGLYRGSSREEHAAIKDKEKLKNDKYSLWCQMIDSDFMLMIFEIYGACSEKFEDFLKKMVTAASEVNHVPYSVLLNYWRKLFAVTLQTFNARLIQRDLVLLDLWKCCRLKLLI